VLLAAAAAAVTNWYYQGLFDTALIFASITPGILRFSILISLALGLGPVRSRPGGWYVPTRISCGGADDLVAEPHAPPGAVGLAIAGITVTTAMLLDMVLLGGGLERSFERLLLGPRLSDTHLAQRNPAIRHRSHHPRCHGAAEGIRISPGRRRRGAVAGRASLRAGR